MKKIIKVLMLLAVCLFAVTNSKAQEIVVRARLHHPGPIIVRPERPSPRHVWVSEEWAPSGGTYVYHEGYWAEPPHPGAIWVAGRWRHHHRGYIWVGGIWR